MRGLQAYIILHCVMECAAIYGETVMSLLITQAQAILTNTFIPPLCVRIIIEFHIRTPRSYISSAHANVALWSMLVSRLKFRISVRDIKYITKINKRGCASHVINRTNHGAACMGHSRFEQAGFSELIFDSYTRLSLSERQIIILQTIVLFIIYRFSCVEYSTITRPLGYKSVHRN